jgi:hypothetical protein
MYGSNDRKAYNRQFQEAATQRKAAADVQYFWDAVTRNERAKSAQNLSNRRVINKNSSQEEKILFSKKVEGSDHGNLDHGIPVERSGPRADEIPVIEDFFELEGKIPSYVFENIRRLRYEKPTPIQKHSVPLGIAGMDLMCCAQTVKKYIYNYFRVLGKHLHFFYQWSLRLKIFIRI